MLDDATRAKITRAQAAHARALDEIRADYTLSELGKRQKIQAQHEAHKVTMADFRGAVQRTTAAARADLERRLFGVPGTDASAAISYRDAQDRVARINRPHELATLLERAAASGDTALERAAFERAWRQRANPLASDGWTTLVADYVAQNPSLADDVDALDSHATDRKRELAERLLTSAITPNELSHQRPVSNEKPATGLSR